MIFSASNLHYIILYGEKKEDHMHLYNTIKDVRYKVYLLENDFIKDKYLEMDKTYISDLINNIDINFIYEHIGLTNESDLNYNYDVSVVTYIDYSGPITGKNANLWKMKETLIEKSNLESTQKNIKIEELVNINYSKYKNIINDFRTRFNISINAYLDVIFSIKLNTNISNNTYSDKSTMTLRMNLGQPIIDITKTESGVSEQLLQNDNKKFDIITPIISNLIIIILVIILVIINIKKKTINNIYEITLKKILRNYSNVIIRINKPVEIHDMKIIDVNEFVDILDIEEELKIPILLFENGKEEADFYIINTSVIYRYIMKND
jgi:hypothetical protein